MIRTGQTVENPLTGERLTFLKTSRDTNGEYVVVETVLQPGARVAAAHVHPYQTERFEVLEGTVGMKVGGKKIEARAGQVVTVEPGVAHRFYNAGDGPARFLCKVSPALGFEELIETMFGLAADGKTSPSGMPSPLRLAVIAKHHFDTSVSRHPTQPAARGACHGRASRQGTRVPARVRACR